MEVDEDTSNQVRGHKAALSNPNTSDEAKANSQRFLDEHNQGDVKIAAGQQASSGNIERGLKSTLSNPNVSDEAKQNAEERLKKGDY